MEEFFAEKPDSTNCEQIDLTLKLSLCGQDAEEKWLTRWPSMSGEKGKSKSSVANGAHCQEGGAFVVCLDRYSCSVPAEGEKVLMRFGDLQTMRRVRTGKRLLLEKQRRAAAAQADKSKLKTLPNPSGDSWQWYQGGASSNIQTSPKLGSRDAMLKEMPLGPRDTNLESPAKKPKQVNPCLKGDAMDILREMPSVTATGDGPRGKRIEGASLKV